MRNLSRNKKLKLNIVFSLILQLVVFTSGIILPKLFIECYGSKVNGLVASIQQFLGFITLGEMGIGAVIQYNLYKPLANSDWKQVSNVIVSANRFFNNLLKGIVVYIIILSCFLPLKMWNQFDFIYTILLILSISFSYLTQYYFGMTYRQLLEADQLSFVRVIPQTVQIVLNVLVCILLLKSEVDIQVVKLVTSIIYSIQPIFIYCYCRRAYPKIQSDIEIIGEPIRQKWNGLAQHFSGVVLKDSGVIILTFFSTLENVSVYSVYNLVIIGIETLIESVTNNFMAVFGELIAKSRQDDLKRIFCLFESIYHMLIVIIFFCIAKLIVPFVSVYMYGIEDAEYIVPVFALILSFSHWLYCARIPYHLVIKAAGHYKETQNSAIIEALINIVVSIVSVCIFGIVGVVMGLASAMLYRSVYYCNYLKSNIIKHPIKHVVFVYTKDLLVVIVSYFITKNMYLSEYTYFCWFVLAVKVFVTTSIVSFVVFFITDSKNVSEFFLNIRKI